MVRELLKPGAEVEGNAGSLTEFGAFVTLGGGMEGLVHVSEIRALLRLEGGVAAPVTYQSSHPTVRVPNQNGTAPSPNQRSERNNVLVSLNLLVIASPS